MPEIYSRILAMVFALAMLPIVIRMMRLEVAERSCAETNSNTEASHPGEVTLSEEMLKRLCPDLYPERERLPAYLDSKYGGRAAQRYDIRDQLIHADARAAVVMSLHPLLVAAYSDDLDAVVMLQFPSELVAEHSLTLHSPLITVNRYARVGRSSRDIIYGPAAQNLYKNVNPLIADFLSGDTEHLERLKRGISQPEWERCLTLGEAYLTQFGTIARDGRPTHTWHPAKVTA